MIRRIRIRTLLFAALLLVAPGLVDGAGGSSSVPDSSPAPQARTPEEIAESRYEKGLKRRDKAWKFEERANAADTEKKREKLLSKAQKQYKKAISQFQKATEKNPSHHRAYSSLGYAYRRTGDYTAAIEAYDTALELSPTYAEAIEYRAEAYLELGQVEDAKNAYEQLVELDEEHAQKLRDAMERWLAARSANPGNVTEATVQSFSVWLAERRPDQRTPTGASSW